MRSSLLCLLAVVIIACGRGLFTFEDARHFVYVANRDSKTISWFEFDPHGDRVEGPLGSVSLPNIPKSIAVTDDQSFLIVGFGNTVRAYRIRADETGIGKPEFRNDFLAGAGYSVEHVATRAHSSTVYFVETSASTNLRALTIDNDRLVALDSTGLLTGSPLSILVAPNGGDIYFSYYGNLNLYRIPLNADGSFLSGYVTEYAFGSALNAYEMKMFGDLLQMVVKETTASGDAWTYDVGSGVPASSTAPLAFPSSLALHPSGGTAYIMTSNTSGSSSTLGVHPLNTSGVFQAISQNFQFPQASVAADRNTVVLDKTGKALIVSHCSDSRLHFYRVSEDGASLRLVAGNVGGIEIQCPIAMATAAVTPE